MSNAGELKARKRRIAETKISDLKWGNAARFIVLVGLWAGLEEISGTDLNSVSLRKGARVGVERKLKTIEKVKRNMQALEVFVGGRMGLDDTEMTVIRGMYRSMHDALKVCEGHLETLRAWELLETKIENQSSDGGINQDELPF